MFNFPYNYNNKRVVHEKIYGDYDIYYYSMRILCDYLNKLEKYQGIRQLNLEKHEDAYNLGLNIRTRIMFDKTYCKDKEISYTTNLNEIDKREFLMYACSELISDYKSEMIEGWAGDKWEKVESNECRLYKV